MAKTSSRQKLLNEGLSTLVKISFEDVEDPRIERTRAHPLINILVIALFGSLVGCKGWSDLAEFGNSRREWLATFLDLSNGIPTRHTFCRVICAINRDAFERAVRQWVTGVADSVRGKTIAVDGQSVRGAYLKGRQTTPLHMVHVYATEQGLLLGHKAADGAWNEPEVIMELLDSLEVEGAVITGDANNTTAAMTRKICERKADYVLCIKGNRGTLFDFVRRAFDPFEKDDFVDVSTFITQDKAHGREEERVTRAIPLADWPNDDWAQVKTAVMVERRRATSSGESFERTYYISSMPPAPKQLAHHIRNHWSIENQLHYVLDVGFDEDKWRIRDQQGAANLATLARLALTFLKAETTCKRGTAAKRMKAGWDTGYLEKVFTAGIAQL